MTPAKKQARRSAAAARNASDDRALLAAQRLAADELGRRLADRHRDLAPVGGGQTGTIVEYRALVLPRGNVVVELPSRALEAKFDTFEECETHAHQLNEWLRRRPAPDARYRMFTPPPEPTEASLIDALDRLFDAPAHDARRAELAAVVSGARVDAERADRESAGRRAEQLAQHRAEVRARLDAREEAFYDGPGPVDEPGGWESTAPGGVAWRT